MTYGWNKSTNNDLNFVTTNHKYVQKTIRGDFPLHVFYIIDTDSFKDNVDIRTQAGVCVERKLIIEHSF